MFSPDGTLVVTYSVDEQMISLFLSRNGDHVLSIPLVDIQDRKQTRCVMSINQEGKQITYADGANVYTRTIPLDRNGDIIVAETPNIINNQVPHSPVVGQVPNLAQLSIQPNDKKEEEEEKFISIGWSPRHIENDPMIPFYEHLLIIAILEDSPDKVKKIVKTYNLNINFHSFMDGWTPLTLACKLGMHKTVRILLKAGADVSLGRAQDEMRPIHAAASSGDLKTVLALVENGANPNAAWDPIYPEEILNRNPRKPPPYQIAPIHIAAVNNDVEILEALLNCGANIEALDSNNRTPIIYAASKKDNLASVQFLVKKGADCTARGRTGTSALHEAAKNDNQKMVLLLLMEGAEAENERNSKGETAVDVNPQLFAKKRYERFLRSDTKTYLKYQLKMKSK